MNAARHDLPPLDVLRRYSVELASAYLGISRSRLYEHIQSGEISVIKDGKRTFVPGSEIARMSTAS